MLLLPRKLRPDSRFRSSTGWSPESPYASERASLCLRSTSRGRSARHDLPLKLWGEAIKHGNWLRNRASSERIKGSTPILAWNPNTRIDFTMIPEFGQKGHAFIYRPNITRQKKLLPGTVFGHLVGMESEVTLFRIFVPPTLRIIITRAQDFHHDNSEHLPSMSTLMDCISCEMELDAFGQLTLTHEEQAPGIEDEHDGEKQLISVLTAALTHHPTLFVSKETMRDPLLPRSLSCACEDPNWAAAIDREFDALFERRTWILIPRTVDMHPVPLTWVFRLKPLDDVWNVLHKARCCARGDQQKPFTD